MYSGVEPMAKSLEQTEGLSAPDAKVLSDIQTFGWHTVGVFPNHGNQEAAWAFSVGFHFSFNHPEVILVGLPVTTCMEIVNVIGNQIKTGVRFEEDRDYADILRDPFKCAFREVQQEHYIDYVGYALWFYEKDAFPLLQCFWPDKQYRFPWDDGCNEYVKNSQPDLSQI
jgi:hypothetical protein